MSGLISVILPVYKTEKYLRRCVDSILSQTFTDFELILVDDGSPDNCGAICDEYANKDGRVQVVHKENGGVSAARNTALDVAKGEYITFVDSDDYVELDYLEHIYDTFQKEHAQVVFFGVNVISEKSNKIVRNIPDLPQIYIEQLVTLTTADLFGYTWIKAISREIIGKTRFRSDLNLFEDEVFTCEIMQKKPTISVVRKPLYNQVVQSNSLSRRVHQDYYVKCEAAYLAWKQLLSFCQGENHPILLEKANHMSLVCKYYLLEKKVPPISFVQGLYACTFFHESNVEDTLIFAIANRKRIKIFTIYILYRVKMVIRNFIGR